MLGFSRNIQCCKACLDSGHPDNCFLSKLPYEALQEIGAGWTAVYLQLSSQINLLRSQGQSVEGYTRAYNEVIYMNSLLGSVRTWIRKPFRKPFHAAKSANCDLEWHCTLLSYPPTMEVLFGNELHGEKAQASHVENTDHPPAYSDSNASLTDFSAHDPLHNFVQTMSRIRYDNINYASSYYIPG